MITLRSLSVALIFCAMPLFAEPELKGVPEELEQYLAGVPKTFLVTGRAEIRVPADKASIRLKVTTKDKLLEKALKQNEQIRNQAVRSLLEKGLSKERIQSAQFVTVPQEGLFSDKVKGYLLAAFLTVQIRDEKEFQAVALVTDALDEVEFAGLTFERSDKKSLQARATSEALENAREKMKAIEEKFGGTLRVLRVIENEPWSGEPQPPLRMKAMMQETAALDAGGEAPTSFDELVFTSGVQVECRLEPGKKP